MYLADLLSNLGGQDLNDEERKRALKWGLLNTGAGILANNYGNYGAATPAIGRGLQQGLLGYQAQLGREEAGAKQRNQAKLMQDIFKNSTYQPTIPGQMENIQGYQVGTNATKDEGFANRMAEMNRSINEMGAMPPSPPPVPNVETFGLLPDEPLISSQLLPYMKEPEPLELYKQQAIAQSMGQGGTPAMMQGMMRPTDDAARMGVRGSYEMPAMTATAPTMPTTPPTMESQSVVPAQWQEMGQPKQGPEQFDMLKAARQLMQSGDPELMQKGFEIYAGLKGEGGEEFGTTPFVGEGGKVYQFGKKGSVRETGITGAQKQGESDLSLGVRENLRVKGIDWRMATPEQLGKAYDEVQAAQDRRVPKQSVVVNPALDPFKNEQGLRKEYQDDPAVKAASEMDSAFRLIETAYKNPSPANDLAMATKYMKVLDPTSVVRESELAMAMNASGMLDRVFNYANRLATGEKLTETQRKDFYDSAKAINDAFKTGISSKTNTFRKIASEYGLNPDNVVMPPAATATPKVETESFKMLPNATKYSGRTITDQKTGKKYRSDGNRWVEVK